MKRIYLYLLALVLVVPACQTSQPIKDINTFHGHNFEDLDIATIQKGYSDGTFTITELVQAYLDRIQGLDQNGPQLHSIIVVNLDALAIAQELDKELKEGKSRGPLHGIPIVLKDNIDTHDSMATTAGSRALAGSHPIKDSYITQKLREAGAVILGKANLSEWANFRGELSTSGWSGVGGQTKNPYILDRNPCGSSSGSGVAVSANLTVLAIGTETNGSIVCPSSTNGIVGIKPTVGLASRSGIIPISFTQDTPGPMAKSVADAATCLGALTGIDSLDSKTLASSGNVLTDYTPYLKKEGLKGKRIGFFKKASGINYKVDAVMDEAIEFLKSQGAEIVELDKLMDPKTEALSFDIMLYEYKDGLNKYFASLGPNSRIKTVDDLIAFDNSDTVELKYFNQKFLEMANKKASIDSKEYQDELAEMTKLSQEDGLDKVMDENNLDAIVAPTGSPAWKTDWVNGDSYSLGSSSPAAISGYPSITVPMGFIQELPVGISFFGKAWSEPKLIEIAYAYEQGTKHRKAPKFIVSD